MSWIGRWKDKLSGAKPPAMTLFGLKVGLTKNDKVPKDTVIVAVHPEHFERVHKEMVAVHLKMLSRKKSEGDYHVKNGEGGGDRQVVREGRSN